MAYVEKAERNGETYYYVTKNFRTGSVFKKLRVYFGKNQPGEGEIKKAEAEIESIAVSQGLVEAKVEPANASWLLLEDIPGYNPLHLVFPLQGLTDFSKFGYNGPNVSYGVCDCTEGLEKAYFPGDRWRATGKAVFNQTLKDPAWGAWLNNEIMVRGWEHYWFSERLRKIELSSFSKEQLAALYKEAAEKLENSQTVGMPWNTMELEGQYLTNHLNNKIANAIEGKKTHGVGQVFSTLTTPTEQSFAQKEAANALRIAALITSDENAYKLFANNEAGQILKGIKEFTALGAILERHWWDYCWLPYMYTGPAWSKEYFIETISGLVRQNPDVPELYQKAVQAPWELSRKQYELTEYLELDERTQSLIEVAKGVLFTKGFRKDSVYHGLYAMEPLLREIGKRLGLTLQQVRKFAPWELTSALIEGKADVETLNERLKRCVMYIEKGKTYFISGKRAGDFVNKMVFEKQVVAEARELKGQCACPGVATGIVKIVNSPKDIWKMQQGDILISHATSPDLVPAMKKAGAIVTEMGGITCHAAVVSRELRIPCVIGIKAATKALKEGETVNVDATHGVIRKLGS